MDEYFENLEQRMAGENLVELYETVRSAQLCSNKRTQILSMIANTQTDERKQEEIDFEQIARRVLKRNRLTKVLDRYSEWVQGHDLTLRTMIAYFPVAAAVVIISLIWMTFHLESGWLARQAGMGALVMLLMLVIFCTSRAWQERHTLGQRPKGKRKKRKMTFPMVTGPLIGGVVGVLLCMFVFDLVINMKRDAVLGPIENSKIVESGKIDLLSNKRSFSFYSPAKETQLLLAAGSNIGPFIVKIKDSSGNLISESINDNPLVWYEILATGRYECSLVPKTLIETSDTENVSWYVQVSNTRKKSSK